MSNGIGWNTHDAADSTVALVTRRSASPRIGPATCRGRIRGGMTPAGDASVATLGPCVEDIVAMPLDPRVDPRASKVACRIETRLGGGALNSARAVRDAGAHVSPCIIVGQGDLGDAITARVHDELPEAVVSSGHSPPRRSILTGGRCWIARPDTGFDRLPECFRQPIAEAGVTVVAPMTPADTQLVYDALEIAPRSVLLLSTEQLGRPDDCWRMMNAATLSVLNDAEARRLTGETLPVDLIRAIREKVRSGVVVTGLFGSLGWLDDNWSYAPRVTGVRTVRTIGAGDVFAGVLASAWSAGATLGESMWLGQSAAARYVAGQSPLAPLDALEAWARPRRAASQRECRPLLHGVSPVRRRLAWAAAAASLLLAMLLGAGATLVAA